MSSLSLKGEGPGKLQSWQLDIYIGQLVFDQIIKQHVSKHLYSQATITGNRSQYGIVTNQLCQNNFNYLFKKVTSLVEHRNAINTANLDCITKQHSRKKTQTKIADKNKYFLYVTTSHSFYFHTDLIKRENNYLHKTPNLTSAMDIELVLFVLP